MTWFIHNYVKMIACIELEIVINWFVYAIRVLDLGQKIKLCNCLVASKRIYTFEEYCGYCITTLNWRLVADPRFSANVYYSLINYWKCCTELWFKSMLTLSCFLFCFIGTGFPFSFVSVCLLHYSYTRLKCGRWQTRNCYSCGIVTSSLVQYILLFWTLGTGCPV